MIQAAGILFLTPDRRALFMQRSAGGDMPGTWCIPGGKVEDGETILQAAVRECEEEAGPAIPSGNPLPLTRSITRALPVASVVDPSSAPVSPTVAEDVDFTAFVQRLAEPFPVTLSDEHTAFVWAPIDNPPLPLHPGCALQIARLDMDELGVARAMAAGQLTSPQRYDNMSLFAIRITGTGVAYRSNHKEYVWRDPAIYLNDEFLARCNGLATIFEHPVKSTLNSKEFADRVVGSVLLPFIPGPDFLAVNDKARASDVWGIAKIYDDGAIDIMSNQPMSTSPAVVFRDPSVNSKMTLEDGSPLLIEGKPSLLDHIAICPLGVWDKAGAPTGVINDSIGETKMTEEDIKAKADAEAAEAKEKADAAKADATAKADAEAGQKLDKILMHLDSLNTRMDAFEMKADAAAEEDKKPDSEEDPASEDEPKRVAADKKKADEDAEADAAEEEEKKAADAAKADSDKKMAARLDQLERMLPKQLSDKDYSDMADAQAKADSIFMAFGDSAPRPLNGEDLNSYRRRLAGALKVHSPSLKDVNLNVIFDSAAFDYMEGQIYSDASAAALKPTDLPEHQLREVKSRDVTGRTISQFVGQPKAWMGTHSANRRRLVGINREARA